MQKVDILANSLETLAQKKSNLSQQNRRLRIKVKSLQEALFDVKDELGSVHFTHLSDKAADIPKHLFENLNKKLSDDVREYDQVVRSFALSLHLISAKAYRLVRSSLQNSLPCESTIRKWCRKYDFSPGLCQTAFHHLSCKVISCTNN